MDAIANLFCKEGREGNQNFCPAPYKIEKEQDKIGQDDKPVLYQDVEPLPRVGVTELDGNVEGYSVMLDAIKPVSPVPIEFENIESGAEGYFHLAENRIAIREGMSVVQTVFVGILAGLLSFTFFIIF